MCFSGVWFSGETVPWRLMWKWTRNAGKLGRKPCEEKPNSLPFSAILNQGGLTCSGLGRNPTWSLLRGICSRVCLPVISGFQRNCFSVAAALGCVWVTVFLLATEWQCALSILTVCSQRWNEKKESTQLQKSNRTLFFSFLKHRKWVPTFWWPSTADFYLTIFFNLSRPEIITEPWFCTCSSPSWHILWFPMLCLSKMSILGILPPVDLGLKKTLQLGF